MSDFLGQLRWQDALDIGVIAFIVNRLIYVIKGTRAVQMIAGLVVILFVYLLAQRLGLFTLHWLLENFLGYMILVIIVIFQSVSGARSRKWRDAIVWSQGKQER